MVAAIKQRVKVRRGGVIQLRSHLLKAGSSAEVIILIDEPQATGNGKHVEANTKANTVPLARMTKQARGDVAEAARVRRAIHDGRDKLIPWATVKRELESR